MKECKHYDNWCEKEKRTCNNCYYERGYNMTDEEKKAIEDVIEMIELHKDGCLITTEDDFDNLEILLNIIEKQQKEIEELKTEKAKIEEIEKRRLQHMTFEYFNDNELQSIVAQYSQHFLKEIIKRDYISKKKLNKKIEDFKIIRDTIIQNEKDLNRPMMAYDLKRNDYCIKMLESLLKEEE